LIGLLTHGARQELEMQKAGGDSVYWFGKLLGDHDNKKMEQK
jgi:hypothetical protein